MRELARKLALTLGLVGTVAASWALLSTPMDESDLPNDPGVRAFIEAYGPLIDEVTYSGGDFVFALGSRPIHFQGGRMLAEGRLGRGECDPIFYRYSLEPLTDPPPLLEENPTYCTDVLESLWGRTEREIRGHGRSTTFLGHRMFVNNLLVDALTSVEKDVLRAAREGNSVATWIDELDVIYSFVDRGIAGSDIRSYHAFGLAVDFVPNSYEGLDVYWRWSRVYNKDWHQIPLHRRWSPARHRDIRKPRFRVGREVATLRHYPLRVPAGNPSLQPNDLTPLSIALRMDTGGDIITKGDGFERRTAR